MQGRNAGRTTPFVLGAAGLIIVIGLIIYFTTRGGDEPPEIQTTEVIEPTPTPIPVQAVADPSRDFRASDLGKVYFETRLPISKFN